jgi:uncharacterized protein involved in exopolysaccharide biosynthesis
VEPQEQTLDLRDLLWRARRYAWLIALPIIACLCGAAIYYKYSTPVYTSWILVSVAGNTQTSPTLDPMVGAMIERASPRERVSVVDSKIHSRAFLQGLVERLGMNENPALRARAAQAARRWKGITADEYAMRVCVTILARKITVSPGRASLVSIAVVDTDPEAARQLAGLIGDVLVEETLQSTMERAQARGKFTREQIALYEGRLRKAEDDLRAFQESTLRKGFSLGIISDQNLTTARSLQRSAEDAMEQLRARIDVARTDWRTSAGDVPIPDLKSPRVTELSAQLSDLETNYALAVLRGDSRGESDALQARITGTRQRLFGEFEQISQMLPGDYSPGVRASMAGIALDRAVVRSLGDRRDRLATEIATYTKSVESSPRDALELQRLKQEVETSRNFLQSLRVEATSSQISESLASSSIGPRLDIVEHPLLPLDPSSPQPKKIFGLAALLGPLMAAGFVFAGERLAFVLRTPEQAEAEYGHRVIGTIPRIDGWSRPGSYLEKHWPAMAIVLVLLVTGIAFALDNSPPPGQPKTSSTLGIQP